MKQSSILQFVKDPRAIAAGIGLTAAVILLAVFVLFTTTPDSSPDTTLLLDESEASSSSTFADLSELESLDAFNVLLLGYGGAGHDGGNLTDVIQLVHIDYTQDVIGLISVPRDLWVEFPSGGEGKINAAFVSEDTAQYPTEDLSLDEAVDGAVKTKSVIEDVTGLTPHFFIGIDFNSFIRAIDELGGVEVDVPETFEDSWYPVKGRELELCGHSPEEVTEMSNTLSGFELERQFPCRYEELSFAEGPMLMDGETALKFVRSRHGSGGGDFDRSLRQQALLEGVRDGLLSLDALREPIAVFNSFRAMINTNLNRNLVKNIAPILEGVGKYKVVRINLTTENVLQTGTASTGAFILVSKDGTWTSVHSYIQDQLSSAIEASE